MEVYLALLIPIMLSILMFILFKRTIKWWSVFIPMALCMLTIFIMKSCMVSYNVSDTEYLSYEGIKVQYFEEWNEYIHKTCSYTTCTGSGKTRSCTTHYYDCSYVKTHPAEWQLVDDGKHTFSLSREEYQQICKNWGLKIVFVELNRNYHTKDGDLYECYFNGDEDQVITTTVEHPYVNKIQASHTVFSFQDVSHTDKLKWHLYDYPPVHRWQQDAIIAEAFEVDPQDQEYFGRLNSELGRNKQVHVFLCIWLDKPKHTAEMQEQYWKGGNKNELNIGIGIDKQGNLEWVHVFTWSDKSIVKVKIRDYINERIGHKLSIREFTNFVYKTVQEDWHRRDFSEFKFIKVDLTRSQTNWVFIITTILSLLTCTGIVLAFKGFFDRN